MAVLMFFFFCLLGSEYAFFIEGFDVKSRYGSNVVDNGTSEWFSITKWTPPKHEDLKI